MIWESRCLWRRKDHRRRRRGLGVRRGRRRRRRILVGWEVSRGRDEIEAERRGNGVVWVDASIPSSPSLTQNINHHNHPSKTHQSLTHPSNYTSSLPTVSQKPISQCKTLLHDSTPHSFPSSRPPLPISTPGSQEFSTFSHTALLRSVIDTELNAVSFEFGDGKMGIDPRGGMGVRKGNGEEGVDALHWGSKKSTAAGIVCERYTGV